MPDLPLSSDTIRLDDRALERLDKCIGWSGGTSTRDEYVSGLIFGQYTEMRTFEERSTAAIEGATDG